MNSPVASYWPIYENLPEGWKFDRATGSPLAGHIFATNGKGVLNGQARALVAVSNQPQKPKEYATIQVAEAVPYTPMDKATRQALNALAREQLKEKLLKDLACDLMVCKIEGWAIDGYIAELHSLINKVYQSIKPTQSELFKGIT